MRADRKRAGGARQSRTQKIVYIKEMQAAAEFVAGISCDDETKAAFLMLSEQFRYSDPISDSSLRDLEMRLYDMMAEARNQDDRQKKIALCKEMQVLLSERNKKCKALKQCTRGSEESEARKNFVSVDSKVHNDRNTICNKVSED